MSRRGVIKGAGGIAGATLLGVTGRALATDAAPVVKTRYGSVRGMQQGRVAVFKGIPYGAPTGGANRFAAPQPPASWTDIRDTVAWGPSAPQGSLSAGGPASGDFARVLASIFPMEPSKLPPSEDCLVLNVWTPSPKADGRKRPVMVWLHGGGFAVGSGSSAMYEGNRLCEKGDVVAVTINHRLNALGYLYLADIGGPGYADSGNAGQLDIIQALQWVRDNIAAFGGDPTNVTIYGESGGGAKVSVLLAMPAAKGLFHKAIIESGPGVRMVDKDFASKLAEQTLAELGLVKASLDQIRTMDTARIIDASGKAQAKLGATLTRTLAPVVDGTNLPSHPFDPVGPTVSADVPVIVGFNKDEATLFLGGDPKFGTLTEAELVEKVAKMAPGKNAEDIVATYRKLHPTEQPTYLWTAISTDMGGRGGSITLAERKAAQHAAPVFMYTLAWETPVWNGKLRAPHGLDLPMVFDTVKSAPSLVGTGPEPQLVANQMSAAWLAFAHSGDPSQSSLAWPAYEPDKRETMFFDVKSKIVSDPSPETRKLWTS